MRCSLLGVRQSFPRDPLTADGTAPSTGPAVADGAAPAPCRADPETDVHGARRQGGIRQGSKTHGAWFGLLLLASGIALGADTAMDGGASEVEMPSIGISLVRVMGALVFVLALFFAGVWMVRNWRRLASRSVVNPDLHVLEVKSLGVRQSLVVVGYRRQRLLLAAAPTGVTLLTHLPEADEDVEVPSVVGRAPCGGGRQPDFIGAFRQVLSRRA